MLRASMPSASASAIAFASTRSCVRGLRVRGFVAMGLTILRRSIAYSVSLQRMERGDDMTTLTMQVAVRERWGEPRNVVRIVEVAKPEIADDQVLVRVRAASINRADYYFTAGPGLLLRPMTGGFLRPKEPQIGGDFAGVVEAVGKDVAGFAPGDEVFGSRTGAFGEYVAARMIALKPKNVSFEEASCVGVGALTALQAIRDHGQLQAGQSVLVNGASGAVGPFVVQIAKALGAAHVTAVCSTRNVEQTRGLGADRVVDYTHEDFTETDERYDLVVDVSATRPWRRMRRLVRPGGRVVLVGAQVKSPLIGPLGYIAKTWVASRLTSPKAIFFVAKFN